MENMAVYQKPALSEFKRMTSNVQTERIDREKLALKRSLESKNDEIIELNQ